MVVKTNLGYGTAYEKYLLFDYAKEWINKYKIKSVLEYPANNLMGNNNEIFSFLLGEKQCEQLKWKDSDDKRYDLVWNFCEYENVCESEQFIHELLEKSNKYVLIITQNNKNIGVPIHFLWHKIIGRKWNHGIIRKFSTSGIDKYLDKKSIVERGAFDCPWFYLDIYESFSDVKSFFGITVANREKEYVIKRSLFERLPILIRMLIAHHRYILINKNRL